MSYRLLCDENVDLAAVAVLTERGYDAVHVTTRPGASSPDASVASTAIDEDRALITNDRDFLDTSVFPHLQVLFYPENRLPGPELAGRIDALATAVPDQADLRSVTYLTETNVDF